MSAIFKTTAIYVRDVMWLIKMSVSRLPPSFVWFGRWRERGGERKKSRRGGLHSLFDQEASPPFGVEWRRADVARRTTRQDGYCRRGTKRAGCVCPKRISERKGCWLRSWPYSEGLAVALVFIYFLPVAAVVGRGVAELQPWRWTRGRLCLLCSGLAGAGTHCGEGQQTGTAPTQIPLWGSCGVCPGGLDMATWSVLQAAWWDRGEVHRCADQWSRRGQFWWRGCTSVILNDCDHVFFIASCLKGNTRCLFLLISFLSEKNNEQTLTLSGVTISVAFTKVGQSCLLNLLSCNNCCISFSLCTDTKMSIRFFEMYLWWYSPPDIFVIWLSCFVHTFFIVNVSLWHCDTAAQVNIVQLSDLILTYFLPWFRSSDSDGAFETPESTTPVKTASPIDPPTQPLLSDGKGIAGSFLSIYLWSDGGVRGCHSQCMKKRLKWGLDWLSKKSSCTI